MIFLIFVYIPPLSNFTQSQAGNVAMGIFDLLFILIMVFTNLMGIFAAIDVVNGRRINIKNAFGASLMKYWKFLLLTLIVYLASLLGLVLFVVPLFIVMTWFSFSKVIMISDGVGIKESLLQSKRMIKGKFWQILIRIVIFGLFSLLAQIILGSLPYGVGMAIYYLSSGLFVLPTVLLYKEVSASLS